MVNINKNRSVVKHSILPDVCGILLFALTLISLFALLSYSQIDLALHADGASKVKNWIGPGGALFADVFFNFFGILAFIFPFLFMYLAILCFWRRRFFQTITGLFGIFIIFLSGSVLLEQISFGKLILPFPLGGVLGRVLSAVFVTYVSTLGTVIITFALLVLGLVMLFRKPLAQTVSRFLEKPIAWGITLRSLFVRSPKRESVKIVNPNSEFPKADLPKPTVPPFVVSQPFVESIHPHIVKRDLLESKRTVDNAEKEVRRKSFSFELPPLNLLNYDAPAAIMIDERVMQAQAERLEKMFAQFGIDGKVREIRPGPVVTLFEFVPAPGIKLSRIAALADDIAMAMAAIHVRVVAPIPGKGAVGIEIPNESRETVYLKEIIAHPQFQKDTHKLSLALGKDIEGKPCYLNLADMPHLLIAGTTGSGKSVALNAMICSILYRATPDDVRFLMIDPKMLELSIYEGIPHLLLSPIVDSKKAIFAFRWAVKEMERRYQVMNELGVRDIYGYNAKIKTESGLDVKHTRLPYIVVVVDEYADLVSIGGKDVEGCVMRLAQKARASGIHVILATQRPSVDVITGVIKANFPVRMGFRLASSHDSKTIINRAGAEKLLGRGDMLMIPPGQNNLVRVHSAFVSEKELVRVIDFWKQQAKPAYDLSIIEPPIEENEFAGAGNQEENDERYAEAIAIVRSTQKCSTSWLQRQLGVGYNRAARMVEQMEREGIIGPIQNARGDREIFGEQS